MKKGFPTIHIFENTVPIVIFTDSVGPQHLQPSWNQLSMIDTQFARAKMLLLEKQSVAKYS